MSVIAEYSIEMDGLVLEPTLRNVDARVDVERASATDPGHPILFVWVTTPDIDAVEAALESDPTVSDVERLSSTEDGWLYRLQVSAETETVLYPTWVSLGGEGLEAYCEDGRWHSRVRFPDRETLSAYRSFLDENGLEFRLERLYDADGSAGADTASTEDGLTDEQRETLRLAHRRGFFDIPRRATAADLAAELDISQQAVSERLRRGYAALVERYVE